MKGRGGGIKASGKGWEGPAPSRTREVLAEAAPQWPGIRITGTSDSGWGHEDLAPTHTSGKVPLGFLNPE